jgi:TPR repeat protein
LSRVGDLSSHLPFAAIGTAVLLASCAAPTSYMGIDLQQGFESAKLRALARHASLGDKYAQLELGILFEEGVQVRRDDRAAELLYERAARNESDRVWFYQPSAGRGSSGHVDSLPYSGGRAGLDEARERLHLLRTKRQASAQ